MKDEKRIQSVDRAVQILNSFSEQKSEWRLTELAQALQLNKSTVHGIINTLKYHGLIDQDENTQVYRLGPALMYYGELVTEKLDIIALAKPIMEDLRDKVEETVHLATLNDLDVVYIEKIESSHSMRIATTRGSRNPSYCTGVGKALLAFAGEAKLKRVIGRGLEPRTPETITDPLLLKQNIEEIKLKGYAEDRSEAEIGLNCLAMPIHDHSGKAPYALSISGPAVRMTSERYPLLRQALADAVKQIENKLGYRL